MFLVKVEDSYYNLEHLTSVRIHPSHVDMVIDGKTISVPKENWDALLDTLEVKAELPNYVESDL